MKYSVRIKRQAIDLYLKGKSTSRISWELGVSRPTVQSWINVYKSGGMLGLQRATRHTLPEERKAQVVRDVLENNLSYNVVAKKYELSLSCVIRWTALVKAEGYTALRKIRTYNNNPSYMKKAKREATTIDMRQLMHENQLLKAENEYLKKLQTLVEKRIARKNASRSKPSKG